jgi:hypothetical protein
MAARVAMVVVGRLARIVRGRIQNTEYRIQKIEDRR